MSKKEWKIGKMVELMNSAQIKLYRERLSKERKLQAPGDRKLIDGMKTQLEGRNEYLDIYKSKSKMEKDTMKQRMARYNIFVYDQAKKDERRATSYNQKSKKESMWDQHVHPREAPKEANKQPLTSAQTYGWREPIDNLNTGMARESVCKRTFWNSGHL